MKRALSVTLVGICSFLFSQSIAVAGVILNVDISDTSAVTFTGNGAEAETGDEVTVGIQLDNFFTSAVTTGSIPGSSSSLFADPSVDNVNVTGLLNNEGGTHLILSPATPFFKFRGSAFNNGGVLTVDMSSIPSSVFPAAGASGNVTNVDESGVYGQWSISANSAVPEPSTLAIFGLFALGFIGYRTLKNRKLRHLCGGEI